MKGLLDSKVRESLANEYGLKVEELEILIELSHSNKIINPEKKFKKLNKKIVKKAQNYIYVKHKNHGFLFLDVGASFSMKKTDLEAMNKALNKKLKGAEQETSNSFLKALSTPPLFKYSQGKLEFHKKEGDNSIFSLKGSIKGDFNTAEKLSQELNSLSYEFKFDNDNILQIHSEEDESTPDPEQTSGELPAFIKELMEELKDQEGVELVCSMTPDGMIGSVYFGQEGRKRLTHAGGPLDEGVKNNATLLQFNVNMEIAWNIFDNEYPKLLKKNPELANKNIRRVFNKWLANKLKNGDKNTLPQWATIIKTSSDALEDPNGDIKLFEVYKEKFTPYGLSRFLKALKLKEEKVMGWHPSRGAAVKMLIRKQTCTVLDQAFEIMKEKEKDREGTVSEKENIKLNNQVFFQVIKKLDSNFAERIRENI